MLDLLIKEIMKPEYKLCTSKPFMKKFNEFWESEQTIFGLEKEDFDAEKIAKITEEKFEDGCWNMIVKWNKFKFSYHCLLFNFKLYKLYLYLSNCAAPYWK